MQATVADVMRLVAVECDLNGLVVLGTVHDAIVIECDLDDVRESIEVVRALVARASSRVLGDVSLATSEIVVTATQPWPQDRAAEAFWKSIDWHPGSMFRPRGGVPWI